MTDRFAPGPTPEAATNAAVSSAMVNQLPEVPTVPTAPDTRRRGSKTRRVFATLTVAATAALAACGVGQPKVDNTPTTVSAETPTGDYCPIVTGTGSTSPDNGAQKASFQVTSGKTDKQVTNAQDSEACATSIEFGEIPEGSQTATLLTSSYDSLSTVDQQLRANMVNQAARDVSSNYAQTFDNQVFSGSGYTARLGGIVEQNGQIFTSSWDSDQSEFFTGIYAGTYTIDGNTYLLVATPQDPNNLIKGKWDINLLSTNLGVIRHFGNEHSNYTIYHQGGNFSNAFDLARSLYYSVGHAGIFNIPLTQKAARDHQAADTSYLAWIKAGRPASSRPSYVATLGSDGKVDLPTDFSTLKSGDVPVSSLIIAGIYNS